VKKKKKKKKKNQLGGDGVTNSWGHGEGDTKTTKTDGKGKSQLRDKSNKERCELWTEQGRSGDRKRDIGTSTRRPGGEKASHDLTAEVTRPTQRKKQEQGEKEAARSTEARKIQARPPKVYSG